jgi:divalent metal cation (Fe/Co/Zn/Cd) transporter
MQMDRTLKLSLVSLLFNMVYSAYHIIFGITARSWWFFSIGIYYAILSIVRFVVIRHKGKNRFIIRFTGIMLMVLALSLVGTVILAFVKDRGTVFSLIVMLTIAVYAFTKIILATIKWIKARKSNSAKLITLRNISFADAFVSIFSLQRSMLVSFEGMSEIEIRIMNIATGCAVCIIVFLLGLNLVQQQRSTKKKQQQ